MPYQLLSQLCRTTLPVRLEDPEDIHKLRVLRSAKLVVAHIPPTVYARPNVRYASGAVALSVTEQGQSAIKRY